MRHETLLLTPVVQRGDAKLHAGARPGAVHQQEGENVHIHADTEVKFLVCKAGLEILFS